jgi:hypothetical protein
MVFDCGGRVTRRGERHAPEDPENDSDQGLASQHGRRLSFARKLDIKSVSVATVFGH